MKVLFFVTFIIIACSCKQDTLDRVNPVSEDRDLQKAIEEKKVTALQKLEKDKQKAIEKERILVVQKQKEDMQKIIEKELAELEKARDEIEEAVKVQSPVVVINNTKVLIEDKSPEKSSFKGIQLNLSEEGKVIDVKLEQKITLGIEGNPSTGYEWVISDEQKSLLKSLTVNYQSQFRTSQVGVGGLYTFEFLMKELGRQKVDFLYIRSPGTDPGKTFSVLLNVTK